MKSFKRLSLLLALITVIGMVPAFRAQAQTACFGLADADCKLISTADANITKLTSFNIDFTFDVTAKMGTQNVQVSASGNGPFAVDASAFSGGSMDPTAIGKGLKMSMDVTGSTKGTGSDQSGKVSFVIVDGVFYYNDGKSGWQGAKLSDIMASANSSMSAGAASNPAMGMMSDPSLLAALAKIPAIPGFVKLEKTANSPELDGQKMVEFVYTLDLKALVTSKDLYPVVRAILKASGQTGGTDMTDDQIAQFGQLAGNALGNTTIKITRWIGEKDNVYHALAFNVAAKIDPSTLGSSGDPTDATISFLVKLTKVGDPVTVTAPAGAKMMSPGSSGSGSGNGAGAATPAATAAK